MARKTVVRIDRGKNRKRGKKSNKSGWNRCGVGVKVPPNYGEWASPPEECSHFRAAS